MHSSDMELAAKLNPQITQGGRKKEEAFEFNKDAGMYVCKAGHLAIRKARQGKRSKEKPNRSLLLGCREVQAMPLSRGMLYGRG